MLPRILSIWQRESRPNASGSRRPCPNVQRTAAKDDCNYDAGDGSGMRCQKEGDIAKCHPAIGHPLGTAPHGTVSPPRTKRWPETRMVQQPRLEAR